MIKQIPKFKIGQKFSSPHGEVEIIEVFEYHFGENEYFEYRFITKDKPIRLNENQLKKVLKDKSWENQK